MRTRARALVRLPAIWREGFPSCFLSFVSPRTWGKDPPALLRWRCWVEVQPFQFLVVFFFCQVRLDACLLASMLACWPRCLPAGLDACLLACWSRWFRVLPVRFFRSFLSFLAALFFLRWLILLGRFRFSMLPAVFFSSVFFFVCAVPDSQFGYCCAFFRFYVHVCNL